MFEVTWAVQRHKRLPAVSKPPLGAPVALYAVALHQPREVSKPIRHGRGVGEGLVLKNDGTEAALVAYGCHVHIGVVALVDVEKVAGEPAQMPITVPLVVPLERTRHEAFVGARVV